MKVLYLVNPLLGETQAEAQARHDGAAGAGRGPGAAAARLLRQDHQHRFRQYDLDAPVDTLDLHTNGHQQSLDDFKRVAGKIAARRHAELTAAPRLGRAGGTPDAVAGQMAEAMQEVGGDGFLFCMGDVSRRTVAEVADGLVPALQRRGLVRRGMRMRSSATTCWSSERGKVGRHCLPEPHPSFL